MGLKQRIASITTFVLGLKVVRVVQQYNNHRGPILSGGLSYQAIFAVFAGLWVSFSVAGIVVQSAPALRDALFAVINQSVPGLIDDGSGTGAIKREDLLSTGALTWTGGIALGGLLFTALTWIASGRDAVRTMFNLPPDSLNFFLLKLKDFGLAVGFGVIILISTALSLGSTAALSWVFDLWGIGGTTIAAEATARIVGLLLAFVIDVVTLGLFYRIVADVPIPFRQLVPGAVLGGAALGVLKALGSALLGGATRNPLLAGFAVIIGLLIWFNLVCQVILYFSSWIAIGLQDKGLELDTPPRATPPVRKPLGRPRLRRMS
jgi:membrane protein